MLTNLYKKIRPIWGDADKIYIDRYVLIYIDKYALIEISNLQGYSLDVVLPLWREVSIGSLLLFKE